MRGTSPNISRRHGAGGERPRERLLALGPGALTDVELDAVTLGTGFGGHTAVDVAREALRKAGGTAAMIASGVGSIGKLPGFGPARAARLAAVLELVRRGLIEEASQRDVLASPEAVRDYLRLSLSALPHETFAALFLDSQNRLLAARELFRGTLTQTSVYPREVVKAALAENAAGVIFAHNHPSGVAEPSRADELLTASLKSALTLVDIRTLDHFVVAGHRVVSFAERGLL
jgi:DNA repair protein RadC